MNHNQSYKPEQDLWLERQKEAIRALRPDHEVDVTDAVMNRIQSMPLPEKELTIGRTRTVLRWAAAACVVGVIASVALFMRHGVSPVTASNDFSASLLDVYDYCNGYAEHESDMSDDAAYFDNPVTYLL